ncbi:polymorphic toxin-type HINT domain-containing protein, partial [Streptomyces zhihengii]
LYGLASSYQYSYEYTETGLLKSTSLPAAGSFAAEKILTRYNNDGLPVSTSGRDWYTAETTYSVYGEVLRTVSGEHPNRVWTSHLYDERTGELERSIVDRESTENPATDSRRVNQRSYAYDPAGNVKKIEDTAGSVTDRQCFAYDVIGQLTRAWTSDQSECAVTADGSPTAVTLGAGDGYHKKYTYDELGNRTEQVDHALKLVDHDANPQTPDVTNADSANDATTTYSYGGTGGKQPHTLTGMTTQYTTDAGARVTKSSTRAYDDAGNMTSRVDGGDEQALSWTWDGKVQKVTGFGDNGSGAWLGSGGMCLDLAAASTTAGTAMQLHTCNGSRAQKLRIDAASATDSSKGALKVLDRCVVPKDGATSDGTAVVIAECTGTGTDAQQWAASTTGNKLKHVSSGKCLAAPGASPASGTKLVLAPCDTDGAQQSWKPANETTYVYGPGGERLMSLTASERVLHLGDTTVSISTSGGVSYTERYYTQPGAPAVMRHSTGTDSTGELSMQVSDQTGTAYVNVKLGAGNTVKFNKLDPFGVKRSENASWRSNRGFVGGHDDTATGLVHLGAREYDPSTGRFISADPVLDLADPVQKNGYIYCENNPVTFADPTGLASDGSGVPDNYYAGTEGSEAWANQQLNMSLGDIILSVGWAVLKEFVGWDAVVGCFSRGDLWACGSLFIEAVPAIKMFKAVGAVIKAVNRIASAIDAWHKAKEKARKIIAAAKAAREAARKAAEEAKAAAKKAAQLAAKRAQEAATRAAKTAAKKTGNAAQKTSKSAATKSQSGAGKKSAGAQPKRTNAPKDAESSGGGSCSVADNSFTPDTLVLMADGTTKRIEDVKNGDQVLATDPETGETRAETVTAEITGQGTKNLVDVTIDTDGNAGTVVSTLTATDGHPFWVPELGEWLDAEDLQQGQWLRTSAGTFVQITAVHHRTASDARVHNLTISDLHTYYVLAGTASVLAHNTNSEACPIAFAVDSAGEATALPVHEIDSVAHAPQAANFQRAVASGAPAIVTRGAGGEAAARRTRRQAQAHAPRPRRFASNATWEEYPFASTVEGGRGATLTLSPGSINSSHGNALKRFYSDSGIGVGDQFIVRILP